MYFGDDPPPRVLVVSYAAVRRAHARRAHRTRRRYQTSIARSTCSRSSFGVAGVRARPRYSVHGALARRPATEIDAAHSANARNPRRRASTYASLTPRTTSAPGDVRTDERRPQASRARRLEAISSVAAERRRLRARRESTSATA